MEFEPYWVTKIFTFIHNISKFEFFVWKLIILFYEFQKTWLKPPNSIHFTFMSITMVNPKTPIKSVKNQEDNMENFVSQSHHIHLKLLLVPKLRAMPTTKDRDYWSLKKTLIIECATQTLGSPQQRHNTHYRYFTTGFYVNPFSPCDSI